MTKFMKHLSSWIINIIFYPCLVLMIAGIILFACGIKPHIIMSGSMEPNIHTGSICFVNTKADYYEIEEGDVIAYQTSTGALVTHRAIAITEEGMETMGDANEVSDGISTTPENFYGETLFSIPYVGYAVKALQKPVYLAVLVVIVAGMFVFSFVDSHFAKKEDESDSEQEEDERDEKMFAKKDEIA